VPHQQAQSPLKIPSKQTATKSDSPTQPAVESVPAEGKPREHIINTNAVEPSWAEPSQLEGISKSEAKQALIALLLIASHEGASDLHISADSRIFVRHHRAIVYKSENILSAEVARALNISILSDEQTTYFQN
jgi:hypothetical protein